MKTYIISLFFFSMTSLVDSLQQVILIHKDNQDIAAECKSLLRLSEAYRDNKKFIQQDSILDIMNDRATAENYVDGQAEYLFQKAFIAKQKNKLIDSEKYLIQLLDKFESNADPNIIARAYAASGFIAYKKADKASLKKYIDKHQLLYDKIKLSNKALIYQNKARYENSFGDVSKAIAYGKKSLEVNLKEGDKRKIALDYNNIGIYFSRKNQRDSSVFYYKRSLEMTRVNLDTIKICENLSYLTGEYILSGNLTDAVKSIEEGRQLAKIIDDQMHLGEFNMHLGRIFQKEGNYEEAMVALNKSLNLGKQLKSLYLVIMSRRHMIQIYELKEDYEKALELIKEDYKTFVERGDKGGQAARLGAMGDIYSKQGKFEMAVDKLSQALNITKSTGRTQHYSQFHFGIAKVFADMELGDSILHHVAKAKEFLRKNHTLGEEQQIQLLTFMAYEFKGDFEKAMKHHKLYHDATLEIINKDKQEYVAKQQVEQNVEMIEKSKAQAEQKAAVLRTRNSLYLFIAIGLLGFLLAGTYFFNQLRKTKRRLDEQNEELQQLNATKDKFFGIIAHDIRSPLIALDGVGELMNHYLKKDNKEKLESLSSKVGETAKKLTGLLDNLLHWALLQQGVLPYNPKRISIKKTADEVVNLFNENAQNKNIKIETNISESEYVFADEAALNTILRNLLSNAIKFTPAGGSVSLSTEKKKDKVYITINDTGTGISAEQLEKIFRSKKESQKGTAGEKGTGLGLNLVKELVHLNNGKIDVKSTIDKGTQFSITLPLAA